MHLLPSCAAAFSFIYNTYIESFPVMLSSCHRTIPPFISYSSSFCRSTAVENSRDHTYHISVRGLSYKIATSDSDGKKTSGESDIELAHPYSGPTHQGAPLGIENRRGSWAGSNKYLLKDVKCDAFPGELMAIAGPSGAGKSTLLDALAGRIRLKSLEGEILVNGRNVESKQFRRITGESYNLNPYGFIV